ncbi:probable NADH dehydrogenase [ubiquinone] iron-sulfur protein 6, mitochondrial [Planococcus citri]|uniref:probable NADH dehydrogenase [ubiquinone] iron-sulfur protein 6, mitochondrial n=1 Tax=Planococcus citri TaxID=170843 RepID=UPI0031F9AC3A
MSGKFLQTVGVNLKDKLIRQISLDSVRFRDVIFQKGLYEGAEDKETHTGQKYEKDDARRLRFMNSPKYVNPNVAIDLIAQVPPIASKDRVVWCDGGDEHVGHPKVYINLDKPGNHSCGYCGLRFYKEDHHHD